MTINITVAGYKGRMGQAVIDSIKQNKALNFISGTQRDSPTNIIKSVDACDIVIDFSSPPHTLEIAEIIAQKGKILVTGVTGFSASEEIRLRDLAKDCVIFMHSNMSICANIVKKLSQITAQSLGTDFDIEICEMHHKDKKDSPSGTAIMYGKACADALQRPFKIDQRSQDKKIAREKSSIGFSSIRGGGIVGKHDVHFLGQKEAITISHQSYDRSVYADGATKIAKWIFDLKIKNGFLDMDDYLKSIIK